MCVRKKPDGNVKFEMLFLTCKSLPAAAAKRHNPSNSIAVTIETQTGYVLHNKIMSSFEGPAKCPTSLAFTTFRSIDCPFAERTVEDCHLYEIAPIVITIATMQSSLCIGLRFTQIHTRMSYRTGSSNKTLSSRTENAHILLPYTLY
jgi:hypothetical protein